MSILLAYDVRLCMKIRLSMQDMRAWEDLLCEEVRNTSTATNSDAKMAQHLD